MLPSHPSRCALISGRIFVEQNVWQNSKMSIEQSTNIIPIIPLISIRKPESEEEEELHICRDGSGQNPTRGCFAQPDPSQPVVIFS